MKSDEQRGKMVTSRNKHLLAKAVEIGFAGAREVKQYCGRHCQESKHSNLSAVIGPLTTAEPLTTLN